MKKLLALLLAILMVLTLGACGNDGTKKENKTNSEQSAFDNGEDVSLLTNEEKTKKATENVLEYLKEKYDLDLDVSRVKEVDFSKLDPDVTVVEVPIDPYVETTDFSYNVITDISKSGEANINFCKDNMNTDFGGWMTRIYYEIFEINTTRPVKDWRVTITPETSYYGIEAKTSATYTYEDLINVMNGLNGKDYKINATVTCTGMEFLHLEMSEEQKAFFDAFEEIKFYYYEAEEGDPSYRYDKSKREFVEM